MSPRNSQRHPADRHPTVARPARRLAVVVAVAAALLAVGLPGILPAGLVATAAAQPDLTLQASSQQAGAQHGLTPQAGDRSRAANAPLSLINIKKPTRRI